MTRTIFADTFYWIALLNPNDSSHARTVAASKKLQPFQIVTTDEVLTEFLNYYGSRGAHLRRAALRLVQQIQTDPSIQVEEQTHKGFLAGLQLYQARLDKGYSLTDCISMNLMRQQGLIEVLTNDHHFSQEGFVCLI